MLISHYINEFTTTYHIYLKLKVQLSGLRALITSYGIPDTILRINEFGGKDRNDFQDWDYSQNVFNYALGLDGKTSQITSSFLTNTSWPEYSATEKTPKNNTMEI